MPKVTLNHDDLREIDLQKFPHLYALKEAYFSAAPELCVERPSLVTQFHLQNNLFSKDHISILDKAKAYRHVLERRKPVVSQKTARDKNMDEFEVNDTSPFAGSTTSKFKGVPIYPELIALILWPELRSMPERHPNPFYITPEDGEMLNLEVFPHWMKKNVLEITRLREYPGQFSGVVDTDFPDEIKLLQNMVFFLTSKVLCISHTIPDFKKALNVGLAGMIKEAQAKKALTSDASKNEFYSAIIEVLTGMINYAKGLAREAKRLAGHAKDSREKDRLEEIAAIYGRVPEGPAQTFREALTTVWMCWIALHLENPNVGLSLGRLDQVLYPFYKRDVERGALKTEEAVELICYLWLKIGDHMPTMSETAEQLFGGTGSNQAITIGGVDKNGEDAVNDLTYVILKATDLMQLRDPNLNARYHPDKNPDIYLKWLADVNISTGATPAIHNDKAVIGALMAKGDSQEQARDYGIVGCVEPVSAGRTYGHNAAVLLNLASGLELALYNGKHRHTGSKQISPPTGDPEDFTTFEKFWQAFKKQTLWLIDRATLLNNQLGETHQKFYPTPILSALFEGPMDKGIDLARGGATINSSGASIIGFADVVDSLAAIQQHVFNTKIVSFSDLIEAMNENYVGYESFLERLSNPEKSPKFGNDNEAADAIAGRVVKMLDEALRVKQNYRGGKYRVGYWTMTMHAAFGKLMKSLPNGRKARENFSSGITPVSGAPRTLLDALHSVAKLPASALSSGVALNIKYTPEPDHDVMADHFGATIKGFFTRNPPRSPDGGFEIQFNIVSGDTFEDALAHPDRHRGLLVRVSGYTAYFIDLNPQMQKEIMERTEYNLSTGKAKERRVGLGSDE
jgi:pyruvate formate-lyase/glycerol dehydratase family glycyl radical enzyme